MGQVNQTSVHGNHRCWDAYFSDPRMKITGEELLFPKRRLGGVMSLKLVYHNMCHKPYHHAMNISMIFASIVIWRPIVLIPTSVLGSPWEFQLDLGGPDFIGTESGSQVPCPITGLQNQTPRKNQKSPTVQSMGTHGWIWQLILVILPP